MPSAYEVSFLEAIKIRRSTLTLAKESPISDERIVHVVKHAIKYAPSPFHVQSCRAIVLFGAEHDKLWGLGLKRAKKLMPPEVFARSEPKIQEYKAAYGTVLFFEDTEAVKKFPQHLQDLIAQFPEWNEHSNGMNQFIVWTALATEGLGCNLQHYQQMIGKDVVEAWNVPQTWSLRAQLVFGKATGPPRGGINKEFAPFDDRIFVYGKKD
ncbi:nitroreductase [Gymnopilus junonius]|uniref:Nitroreductase n=1 Tax=Gymnopilus junonius TaxID=109634 RepID=A0A9P5TN80_GYMJU|nr:nitroreductase [Gymnopilus junonius]